MMLIIIEQTSEQPNEAANTKRKPTIFMFQEGKKCREKNLNYHLLHPNSTSYVTLVFQQ